LIGVTGTSLIVVNWKPSCFSAGLVSVVCAETAMLQPSMRAKSAFFIVVLVLVIELFTFEYKVTKNI
jgi:hypothetical protein